MLSLVVLLLLAVACGDSDSISGETEGATPAAFPPPWPAVQPTWDDRPAQAWPGPRPKRVIVLGIDTLRADHLQGFGADRRTAPNLAALTAEDGAFRFLQNYAQASWTLPSMTSVFTSLYPPQHQVEDRGLRLSPDIPTLAGAFAAQGWMTAGFVTHIYVSSLFGLDSGFLTFRELSIDWNYNEGKQLRAEEVMSHVVPWVHHHRDIPFFLYVHLFDPHWDYDPPPPFDRAFADPDYDGPASGRWSYLMKHLPRDQLVSEEELQHVRDLYDGEILYTDDVIGRFIGFLKSAGLWKDTLLVILSDHGEEFQEHGSFHHIRTLYDEVLHVPLIVRPPGGVPRGWRGAVDERVRNVDIGPTVLAIAGLRIPDTFEGESLIPLMQRRGEHRRVFAASRTARYGNALSSLHTQRYKVILSAGSSSSPGLEVFLHEDEWEQENLAFERPDLAERLQQGIVNRIGALEASRDGLSAPRRDVDLTEAQEERLRALGYIQ